ncbi:unnamed protein product [Sphagnum troendelagicum]
MPTQRWRWRPWRVLRQATGAVEAVPPDTGHLIPRLLFFYSTGSLYDGSRSSFFFFFLSARIQLQLRHKKLDAKALLLLEAWIDAKACSRSLIDAKACCSRSLD